MRLIIIGAGKYGLEIEDIAEQTGRFTEIGFLDDNAQKDNVLGKCADFTKFKNDDTVFYVAFGNNESRKTWIEALKEFGAAITNIVHPTAYISPKARLGEGIAVLPQTIVNSYTELRDGVIVNSGAIVDHDCVIGACAHICVGAIVKADNVIPAGIKIEAGQVIERETYKGEI